MTRDILEEDPSLKGSLLALQSCEKALNEYRTDAATRGHAPTAKAIADILGYVTDAISDCRFELDRQEKEANREADEAEDRAEFQNNLHLMNAQACGR